jgi:sulfonate transport system substrate-binding protein
MKYATLQIRLATALALGLAGLSLAQEQIELRFGSGGVGVGGRPVVGGSIFGYLASKGILDRELGKLGVTVKWSFLSGAAPAINEAFSNGLLDVSTMSEQASLIGRGTGNRYKVILAASRNAPFALVTLPDSRIRSVAELKGKRVVISKGTAVQLQAGRLLAANGLTERDITVVNVLSDAVKSLLVSRQIEAAFISTTAAIQYQDQGISRTFVDSRTDSRIPGTGTVYLVSEDFERKHPEVVQKLVDLLVKYSHDLSLPENREGVLTE